jgi:DNA-directed RNA polymerase specialized sigma24 family protein
LTADEDEDSLAARLARHWQDGDRESFSRLAVAEGMPRLVGRIAFGLNLQESDAEDCVAEALHAVVGREDGADIADPYAYWATAARNLGNTLYRRRRLELVQSIEALSPSGTGDADSSVRPNAAIPPAFAVIHLEETLDDIEAEESWAVPVLEAALEKLTARQRTLIRHLAALPFDFARQDFDVRAQEAADALGMTAQAFRKAKQRAYEALRAAVPQVVAELGITPPPRFVAAFEDTPRRLRRALGEDGEE